jgi:DNA-binding HxlR family transcriptional regulator
MRSQPDWCPVARTLEIIGGKWTPLIMFYLKDEPRRFNALRRLIPEISQRMLTLQLRALEGHGVVARKVFATVPPHVEYSLTGRGRSLGPIIEAMEVWGADDLTPSQIANDRRYRRDL